MKRYDLVKFIEWGGGDASMEEAENGDYVKYEDVQKMQEWLKYFHENWKNGWLPLPDKTGKDFDELMKNLNNEQQQSRDQETSE